jgi:CheY-like chemotaxis protein
MVVEDEPDIYDVLLAMFEIWGIEGIAFVDGAEAVAWIEDVDRGSVTGELPELAILDIRLPEVSGPEVGARLRKSERLGRIAVVLITAYRLNKDEEEQVKTRAQADTLMYKPLPPMPELRKILAQIIGARREKAALLSQAKQLEPAPPALPAPPAQQTPPPPAAADPPAPKVEPARAETPVAEPNPNVPSQRPEQPS